MVRKSKAARVSRSARTVVVSRVPVELFKILKFEAMVNSGGQAKAVIADGAVRLNGQIETQKRKKIVAGDVIEFNGERVVIRVATPDAVGTEGVDVPRRRKIDL